MTDFMRLLLLLALSGAALTLLGGVAIWFMEEERRIRRAFRRVLKGQAEALVVAKGQGRAAGFCFSRGVMGVAWDTGAWCLVYKIDELMGAELVVDGEVVGRAYRGEPRRPLDQVAPDARQVTLRMVFDDAKHPDFDLDLWLADDPRRRGGSPAEAVQEANRWLARAEAILRRPAGVRRAAPAIAPAAAPPVAAAGGGAGAIAANTALAPDNDKDFDDLDDVEADEDDEGRPPF
jgi:hypothetical protein